MLQDIGGGKHLQNYGSLVPYVSGGQLPKSMQNRDDSR